MVNFTVKSCYPDWLKIASRFCHQVLFSSRTEHRLTRRRWLKTGLPPTAVTSSEKTNDHWPPNSPSLNPLYYHVWGGMLERYKTFQPKPNTTDELKKVFANNMGWSTTKLHQQGRTELYQKTSRLHESWRRTLWTRLQINCDSLKCQISMFRLISIQTL